MIDDLMDEPEYDSGPYGIPYSAADFEHTDHNESRLRMKSYTEIRETLEDLPQTWCPALLFVLVKTCLRKKVFRPGGIETIIKRAKYEAGDLEETVTNDSDNDGK